MYKGGLKRKYYFFKKINKILTKRNVDIHKDINSKMGYFNRLYTEKQKPRRNVGVLCGRFSNKYNP